MADEDSKREQAVHEAMDTMRGQAAALGMKVDPNWTPEQFAQAIIDAQVAVKAKQNDEFQKAKKVKVRMKRDGFPLDDMKVPAGNTCDVPIEMARRWLELGVCERADPLPDL